MELYPPDDPYFINFAIGTIPIVVRWYGVFIVGGAMIAAQWAGGRARERGIDPDHVWNLLMLGMVFGVLGARLYYVAFEWPRFAGRPPVHPDVKKQADLAGRLWRGAQGLAEDVRYYGQWMRDQAEKRIGHLYPKVEVTAEMVKERPDLKPYLGRQLTVIAWLWARTVKSPNPAFAQVDVPLVSTFMLSTKAGKTAYVRPVIEDGGYRFTVRVGNTKDAGGARNGTKLSRGANFRCLMSESTPIDGDYIKAEGKAGRMGTRLMAIVAQGDRGRVYLSPTNEMESLARKGVANWKPEQVLMGKSGDQLPLYGINQYWQLFTPRQLAALTTFADLVAFVRQKVASDVIEAGLSDNMQPLATTGSGAMSYANSVGVYLAIAISRMADYGSTLATWRPKDSAMRSSLPKQALQMNWDFAEGSPFGKSEVPPILWTP